MFYTFSVVISAGFVHNKAKFSGAKFSEVRHLVSQVCDISSGNFFLSVRHNYLTVIKSSITCYFPLGLSGKFKTLLKITEVVV